MYFNAKMDSCKGKKYAFGCHPSIKKTASPFASPTKVTAKDIYLYSSAINTFMLILHFPFFKYNKTILGFIISFPFTNVHF